MSRGESLVKYAAVFAAGVAVGANWPRIKKTAAPFLELLKAQYGDSFAELIRGMAEEAQDYDEPVARATSRRAKATRKPAADLAEAFAAAARAGAAAATRDASASRRGAATKKRTASAKKPASTRTRRKATPEKA